MTKETSSGDNSRSDESPTTLSSSVDLVAVLLSTFFVIVLVFLPYGGINLFRQALGIIVVIFNPGYALAAALFPRKYDLSNIERVTLAFGLSIAIVPLLAFGLAYSSPMIVGPLVGVIALVVTSCSVVGVWRRRSQPAERRFTVQWSDFYGVVRLFSGTHRARERVLNILLVGSLLVSASVVVYAVVTPAQGDRYTEFYLLNANGKAEDYPTSFSLANLTSITVGVVNHEGRAKTYDLIVAQNGSPQSVTLYSQQLTVSDNSQWEETIFLTPVQAGNNTEFKFLLYEQGNDVTPYRETHLLANVTR